MKRKVKNGIVSIVLSAILLCGFLLPTLQTGNFYETFPFTNGGLFAMIDIARFSRSFCTKWQMQLDNLYLVC